MLNSIGEGKHIDADYSFTPRFTNDTEVSITPGPNTRLITTAEMCSKVPQSTCDVWKNQTTSSFFEDTSGDRSPSAKMTFTNVGVYNNQKIDMVVETTSEYTDVLNSAFDVSGASRSSSASAQTSFTRKATFISHETGQPVEVKGYISFSAINAAKTMLFDLPIKDIFAINSSTILYDNGISNGEPLFVKGTAPGGTGTPDTMMTLVFEQTSAIAFTETYAGESNVRQTHGTGIDQFSLTGINPPGPVKFGSTVEEKKLGNNEYPNPREGIYEIVQSVPYSDAVNYYKSFEITDNFDGVLIVEENDIKIQNTLGDDVTSLFDISVVDNQLSI
ncbi:hypothetical protein, partial [Niallia circulans]|uniref:hypothetical protein n=1 Tax=Niallia circulans TaxID=1397 RepID=UPI00155FEEC9